MRKGLTLIIISLLLIMPCVFAVRTEIHVNTIRDARVYATFQEVSSGGISNVGTCKINLTDMNGDGLIACDISKTSIDIITVVYEGDKSEPAIPFHRFEKVDISKPVYLSIFPNDFEVSYDSPNAPQVQPVENTTNNITSSNVSGSAGITGNVVSNDTNSTNGVFSKTFYYILGIVVLVLFLGFVVFKFFMSRSINQTIVTKPMSQVIETRNANNQLEAANKRIEELQKELTTVKNQEKIKEVERKLEADRQELDRLRRGF